MNKKQLAQQYIDALGFEFNITDEFSDEIISDFGFTVLKAVEKARHDVLSQDVLSPFDQETISRADHMLGHFAPLNNIEYGTKEYAHIVRKIFKELQHG